MGKEQIRVLGGFMVFSSILELNCVYQKDGDMNTWNGLALVEPWLQENKFNIEGIINDNDEKKYILGISGYDNENKTISFTLLSNNISIEYYLTYDEKDNCLYGSWYDTSLFGGFVKLECNNIHLNISYMYSLIEIIGHKGFYINNNKEVAYLLKTKQPTIDDNISNYELSKKFFHEIESKTKVKRK